MQRVSHQNATGLFLVQVGLFLCAQAKIQDIRLWSAPGSNFPKKLEIEVARTNIQV